MASRLSNVYEVAAKQHEYSYPISNITYHLPDSSHPGKHEAVAKKAFQRIMDNYDENERLADAFQVELDKRKQIADERKAEERRIRAERQLQLREEKRIKKLSKYQKATTASSSTPTSPPPYQQQQQLAMSVATLAQALQPRHGRYATAGYSLVGLERERGHRRSIDTSGLRSRQSSEGSLHSAIGGLYGAESAHEGEARMVESRLSLASDHPSPHSPPLLHAPFRPADRSLSNSPVLPLTPSPHLKPSDTAFGVVAPFSTVASTAATTALPTSSAATTTFSGPDTSISSSSSSATATSSTSAPFTNNTSLPTPPPQSGTLSTLPMRNKRKQAIPVHPSVIKRIPGITFRIQPDLNHHLQVEILKNIDDYQSTSLKVTQDVSLSGHSIPQRTDTDKQDDGSRLQANQDLSKVQQSITSSRPGYASLYIPDDSSTYEDPYLQDYRETSPHTVALHVAPNNGNSSSDNTRYHPYQRHSRSGSLGSGRAISNLTPNNLRSRSNSSANIWAPYAPSPAGLAMLLSDVVAARATLPLSWDNFSTRDCQVNKVVGKNGRDFEQLEAVVQETVARHQAVAAAAAAAQEEANQENQEDEQADVAMAQKQEQKSSSDAATAAAKGSSGSTADAYKKRKSVPATTPPPPSHAPVQGGTGSRSTRSRTTHATEGARRSSRAVATDLVEGYDDIERILKEKRQKKREQQRHRDSQSRGVSEITTEGDYDMDTDMEQPRIKEDVDADDRSALLRGYAEIGAYSETHPRRSTTKPPSPPHSRQVTPAAKFDLGGSSLHPHQQHTHLGSGSSRTPPATPTRASARHPQPTTADATHHDEAAESTGASGGRTRARARSFSSTIPTDAKTNFFESALEMIEAKRRQSIAKKKASAATASLMTAPTADIHQSQQPDEQQQQANRQLKQDITNETFQKMEPNSNIPKSSKLLTGRVLRKPRGKTYEGSDQDTASEKGSLGRDQDGGSASAAGGPGEVAFDPDCSSCRLDVSDTDLALWKQARQSGEIHLNPKTWGRTAILCSSCRMQYLRHGLRCTQCFYVPVWNPEPAPSATSEASEGSTSSVITPAVGAVSSTAVMPKPGETCRRCKAGTWLQEA